MPEVLYRKYRPKVFAEVINQESVKTILQNAVRFGRISHAYLFTGPRGVGKTTIARILARAVNCANPIDGEPDMICQSCQLAGAGRFLDLVEIDAASYTGVDNIREIIEHVRFAPAQGKYKVFIIDEVHMLSKAAFNALLKTLEEPPAHAIFILATTEIHKVPATIISRVQRFDFKRIGQRDILKLFETVMGDIGVNIPEEALKVIAEAADGSFRDALSILDQILSLGGSEISVGQVEEILGVTRMSASQKLVEYLANRKAAEAGKFVRDLAFEGRDLVQFVKATLEYLRILLYVKIDVEKVETLGVTDEEGQKLLAQAREIETPRLLEIIKKILEAYREMKQSPIPELPVLTAVLSLTGEAATMHAKKEILSAPAQTPAATASPLDRPEPAAPSYVTRDSDDIIDLGLIVERWAEVLGKVKDYNQSLLSSLRLGRIVGIAGKDLTIAFPYSFHRDMIDARKNRIVVEQVLEDTFGQKINVKVHLERDLGKNSDLLGEAMKVLGGTGEK